MIVVISSDPIFSLDIRQALECSGRTPIFIQRTREFDINKLSPVGIKAIILDTPLDDAVLQYEMRWLEENQIPTVTLSTEGQADDASSNLLPMLEHFEKPIIVEDILPALVRAAKVWANLESANSKDPPLKPANQAT